MVQKIERDGQFMKIRTLNEARAEKGILIATHRGEVCGNIPHNSLPAFEAALRMGSDMLETDITLTGDGVPVIFHPRQELNQLKQDVHIDQMSWDEVKELRYVNDCRAATQWGILTLDEFLEAFKGRAFLNLDHCWHYFEPVIKAVRRHNMLDQVLMKAPGNMEYAQAMEQLAPDMMFMTICKQEDTVTEALEKMDINLVGVELVFATDDSPLVDDAYIQAQHDKGRLLWCNTILYNYLKPLSGGHTDDISVTEDPDKGWGWVVEKGFDIIQTDWTLALRQYLQNRSK